MQIKHKIEVVPDDARTTLEMLAQAWRDNTNDDKGHAARVAATMCDLQRLAQRAFDLGVATANESARVGAVA